MTKEESIERFERYLMGEKRSFNTIREYKSIVKNFLNFVNKEPEKITIDGIEKYREYMAIEKSTASRQYISQ